MCGDGIDDDGDGLTDCDDLDCQGTVFCDTDADTDGTIDTDPIVDTDETDEPMDQPVLQPPSVEQVEVRLAASGGGAPEPVLPLTRFPERTVSRGQIEGLDIPTFIRRQMD